MKILISNDDGIDSQGIQVLAESLKTIADIVIVAPKTEQSAVGHAITMKIPLRVIEYYKNGDFFGYAVEGTPADCVKMGIRNILKSKPDLVVSGINHGSNTAVNIIYSGTVSAAREAAIMDVPAMAISITNHFPKNFTFAGQIAKKLAKLIVKHGLLKGTCLNVNIPDLPVEEVKGISITKQGKSSWDDVYEERLDPYGRKYYWLTGKLFEVDKENNIDQIAVQNNYVSVTPIHFDLTDNAQLEKMKSWELSLRDL